jgi:hypothetical protein
MLWTIIVILLVLWLLGVLVHIGGQLDPPPARNCCLRPHH